MDKIKQIIKCLADGEYHSGEALGQQLGITRAAIWKLMNNLTDWGLELESSTKKGYRLHYPLELLSANQILKCLSTANKKLLGDIEILTELPSTNTYLLESIDKLNGLAKACFAERQTAGKGRCQRTWISPFGTNIYFSLRWIFNKDLAELSGLSLLVATSVIEALHLYGIKEVGIKWPNDIIYQKKKLAGILIETRGISHDQTIAVIGIGLNVQMPLSSSEKISQPWTDVYHITKQPTARNRLAGLLLDQLISHLTEFETKGIHSYLQKWRSFDLTMNQPVSLQMANQIIHGIARGIDEYGRILIEDDKKKITAYSIGDISLRLPA